MAFLDTFTGGPIFWALVGGILPAIIWLIFWLHEDSKSPEPRGYILRTFILGMVAVIAVLPFQKQVDLWFPGLGLIAFLLWAVLEELFKFIAAYFGGIHTKEDNEPIDPLIYMITAALGFVALENTLFIANPLLQKDLVGGIITGNLRFIGASLLHVVASAAIGAALALNFYKPYRKRVYAWFKGFLAAVGIHAAFNLFIINQTDFGVYMTFAIVWSGITLLLLFFEKVKRIAR